MQVHFDFLKMAIKTTVVVVAMVLGIQFHLLQNIHNQLSNIMHTAVTLTYFLSSIPPVMKTQNKKKHLAFQRHVQPKFNPV